MRARATLVAEVDGTGATRLTRIRSEPPLVLRATAGALYLVGGAGGPLGGDDLALHVTVGPGASLTVRTSAASVALPGDGPSKVAVTADVGAGGRLEWLPEPVVAASGCRHLMTAAVTVAADGSLVWREEILLGRHGEPGGSVLSRFTADVDGAPLLRHELALGPDHPGAAGPAVAGPARAAGSVVLVGPEWGRGPPPSADCLGPTAAVMPLAGPGVQVVALAAGAMALRRSLDAGMGLAGVQARSAVDR